MNKPTPDELVRRVEALEAAVDQMFGALKADLAALRADLVRLKSGDVPSSRTPSADSSRAPSGSFVTPGSRKISSPNHALKEESIVPRKKDPRSDE